MGVKDQVPRWPVSPKATTWNARGRLVMLGIRVRDLLTDFYIFKKITQCIAKRFHGWCRRWRAVRLAVFAREIIVARSLDPLIRIFKQQRPARSIADARVRVFISPIPNAGFVNELSEFCPLFIGWLDAMPITRWSVTVLKSFVNKIVVFESDFMRLAHEAANKKTEIDWLIVHARILVD